MLDQLRQFKWWLTDKTVSKRHILFVDITLTSFSTYLGLKKAFGWTLTGALAKVFQLTLVESLIQVLLVLCVYACVAKIVLIYFTAFPPKRVKSNEAAGLATCCLLINEEMSKHADNILTEPTSVAPAFRQNHNFDVNVMFVTEWLARHMLATLDGATEKDVFISVFKVPKYEDLDSARVQVDYVCHYPPSRDGIVSKVIIFKDGAFQQYECVKCISENSKTRILLDGSKYYKSRSKRHKKIKHYIGLKIEHKGVLLGFLNVELYNSVFFATEDELQSYVEHNVLSFKYLIEYQFLKGVLFTALRPHLK